MNMFKRIEMPNPIVEMDGDEMARVIWSLVKENLISPFVELRTEYYDLGLVHREETRDAVTAEAAEAVKRHKAGVKCATITPNDERVKEYGLSEKYKSPNGTIRGMLDGTVFRAPIIAAGIEPYVTNWKSPITIARHAFGDVYRNAEVRLDGADANSFAELVVTSKGGVETRQTIFDFGNTSGGGVVQGIFNTDESITSFARSCFSYALETKQELWFGTKDTISKIYDRRFRDIFENVYEEEYREKFEFEGIKYFYTLIDDVVARIIRSEGGVIWACKNYDGDVMSDMVATAFGSLAMMTSVLVSPHGYWEYEAAHGTVQKHYYKHLAGEQTSTNSVATIFAWAGALKKRGQLDHHRDLITFAERLEIAALKTIEDGVMTGDLYTIS
ncbi:MAG: NADP-dependent isocitrate dehydrogenase, partial [Clostridiales Family XIII bacterium]|nr:NADP-dependent isocitrate dehydrogenase [Clostridiales Family XIII bacterium]